MALKKSALAVAVTVALSSHAFAAGPGGDADLGFQGSIGKITVGTETQDLSSLNTQDCTGKCDEHAPDHKYISINTLRGTSSDSPIKIHDADLKLLDFDLNGSELSTFSSAGPGGTLALENVKSELTIIETNGTTIENTGSGAAIDIAGSALTGADFQLDPGETVPAIFKGHKEFLTNNGGEIIASGGDASAIHIHSGSNVNGLIVNGLIINEDKNSRTSTIFAGSGAGIFVENSTWKGGVANTESEIIGNRAGIELRNTKFEGAIQNERSSSIGGSYGIALIAGTEYIGNIDNSANIVGGMRGIYIDDSVTGNLVINQTAGLLYGGEEALRMNKITRTNFTGGEIFGNVSNHGGTFYVEGNQTIDGDYMQTSGSTLAMGLHKETSLTANSIDLAKGSKVQIDLSKGDLYVRSGDKFELLKVEENGELTVEEISYEIIGSKLVTIAGTPTVNSDGYLEFEFDRAAIADIIDDKVSKGEYKGKTVSNMRALAKAVTGNAALEELVLEKGISVLPDLSGASRAAAMGATNQSNTQVSVRARGLASGDSLENTGLWVQGIVSKGDQDNRNGEAYDVKSRGFVLGADTELNSGAVAGAAYSFVKNEINTQNSRTDSDYHMATLYSAQAIDQVLLDGQAYYAWGSNDSSRDIGASASYDSNLYGARVGAGYQFDLDNAARFIPTLSLEASRLSVDGYTESGAAGLKMDKQHFNRLELGLSTELSKDYQLSKAMVTPSITLGAFHDFKADTQNSTVAFAVAPAETFNVEGNKPEKTRYVAGAGVDIVNNGNLTVSAEYNYNWNTDGFDANSGALKFRWDF